MKVHDKRQGLLDGLLLPEESEVKGQALYRYEVIQERVLDVKEDEAKASDPEVVAELLKKMGLAKAVQEHFIVLHLNTKNYVKGFTHVSKGLLDRSPVHAREVFRAAVHNSDSKIILAHNHPSGDPTPSAQDIKCTENLVKSGKILGIEVLDHIIIGHMKWISLRSEGLMPTV